MERPVLREIDFALSRIIYFSDGIASPERESVERELEISRQRIRNYESDSDLYLLIVPEIFNKQIKVMEEYLEELEKYKGTSEKKIENNKKRTIDIIIENKEKDIKIIEKGIAENNLGPQDFELLGEENKERLVELREVFNNKVALPLLLNRNKEELNRLVRKKEKTKS